MWINIQSRECYLVFLKIGSSSPIYSHQFLLNRKPLQLFLFVLWNLCRGASVHSMPHTANTTKSLYISRATYKAIKFSMGPTFDYHFLKLFSGLLLINNWYCWWVLAKKALKCKPSAEMRPLAREGFHVNKVEEDRPTKQPSVKGYRQSKHATKWGTSFPVFPMFLGLTGLLPGRRESVKD